MAKYDIFKDAMLYYFDHPYEFICDVILDSESSHNYPTAQQEEELRQIEQDVKAKKPIMIAVKSGHGTGKTAIESWLIIWFMSTRPHCKVPCTAPTQTQLFDILWSEVAKWIGRIKDKRIKDMFEWTATHLTNKYNPETWFAVAKSSKQPENMQGFHADNLLFIIDEASGVAQNIMEVIQGALTNEGAMCIMHGNPTKVSGVFFDAFHKDRNIWRTFTFNSENSPLVSPEYIQKMKDLYGADSDIYRVRVLGEFPTAEENTLIPLTYVEQSANNDLPEPKQGKFYIGVDVARFGDDKTEICIRRGNKVINWITLTKRSTMETVGYIMQQVMKYKDKDKIAINVDDTGVGGGVTDRLNELLAGQGCEINGVNNGSKAFEETKYNNAGTEMWWHMRENIREWNIPNDETLMAQLCTRRYKIGSTGKIEIEKKEDLKKRGLPSPDKADALALAFRETMQTGGVILF